MFVTDGYIDETLHDVLLKEEKTYNDMIFLPVDEGLNFGMRLLFMMEWAQAKYKPEFFLRIDDDYFLCIERLLNELPQRPKKKVVWGFWHCDLPTVTFIDESFILLTFDLVETFLSWDESSLLCHPFGDQQLAIWLNHLPAINAFFDIRLHHHPPASKTSKFSNMVNICDRYLGLHGTYPNEMRKFWVVANDGKKRLTEWISVYPKACHYRPYFKWRDIKQQFRHKPELCKNNPRWTMKREMWVGRE
jgi:hypothetical protein